MKKTIFIAGLLIFTLGATTTFAGNAPVKSKKPVATENQLSAQEVSRLTKRVEEIRSMDKSKMTTIEKRELRKEVKAIKENVKKGGGAIYISTGAILLILLIILLL